MQGLGKDPVWVTFEMNFSIFNFQFPQTTRKRVSWPPLWGVDDLTRGGDCHPATPKAPRGWRGQPLDQEEYIY